jgi:hypothetical protein
MNNGYTLGMVRDWNRKSPSSAELGSCIYFDILFGIINLEEYSMTFGEAQCQSARCAIAKAKQSSQRPVMEWMTKIYNLELLHASEGTLSRWSRLHLQSFVPTPVTRRVDVRQAAGRKNDCRTFITT